MKILIFPFRSAAFLSPSMHFWSKYRQCQISLSSNISQNKERTKVFDRKTKLLQRERVALLQDNHIYDYLKDEVGFRLAERILDIKKDMREGLDLGCGKGHLAKNITHTSLEHLRMCEYSPKLLELAREPEDIKVSKRVLDEEETFPFDNGSLDIVVSNLNLHWVNDLPGCLREIHRVLRKDGVFLASMFGCDTLYELRSSLVLAELEREGGFALHISPFTQIRDIAGLLNRAGFSMLTLDTDELIIRFPSMFELMEDLKGMAESNASINRKLHLHRDSILASAAIYKEMYGDMDSIPATFQVIYMIGWKPDPSKAVSQSERGSGQVSFKDLDKLDELVKEHGMEGRVKFLQDQEKKEQENHKNSERGDNNKDR